MTNEEKARAYDEALERARKMLNMILDNELLGFPDQIREIFPQLRESEDERIRKEIVNFFKNFKETGTWKSISDVNTWIAYLEKQKEEEGYEAIPVESTLEYKLGFKAGKESEKQKPWKVGANAYFTPEQKPAEIDEYEIIKKHITYDSLSSEVNKRLKECGWYVTEKPIEWSEDIILKAVKEIGLTQYQINWFKSNVFPPKPEWSEEDEKMINMLVSYVEDPSCWNLKYPREKLVAFIKSLRPQYHGDVTMTEAYKMGKETGEASHWRPSEEQMKALEDAFRKDGSDEYRRTINSLYQDLKKL